MIKAGSPTPVASEIQDNTRKQCDPVSHAFGKLIIVAARKDKQGTNSYQGDQRNNSDPLPAYKR